MFQKPNLKLWKGMYYLSFLSLSIFLFSACETDNLTLEPTLVSPLVNGEVGLDVNAEADLINAEADLAITNIPSGNGTPVPANNTPLNTPPQTETFQDLGFSEIGFNRLAFKVTIENRTGVPIQSGLQLIIKNENENGDTFIDITTNSTIDANGGILIEEQTLNNITLKSTISVQALNITTGAGTLNGSNNLKITIEASSPEVDYILLNDTFQGDFMETTDFSFDLGNDDDLESVTGEIDFTLTSSLPLELNATLVFLDANDSPLVSLAPITLGAGSVDSPQSGSTKITGSDIDALRNASKVQASVTYNTPTGQTARLESGAKLAYNLSGKITPSIKL